MGLVNQARSNYRFNEVASNVGFYGCHFEIDKKLRLAEPDDRVKGVVARANLFMADNYGIKLSDTQRQLFLSWNQPLSPK